MYKCLKILLGGQISSEFLRSFVYKHATQLTLEGTAQMMPEINRVCLTVCGQKKKLDDFIDLLHQQIIHEQIHSVEIEPFLKTKDYRGVFRIIE
jgi:hydrogenase maturation factor HypF (carbamoyltransferase family)